MRLNFFLIIFLTTLIISLFMSCYVAAMYALTLAKAHKVPQKQHNFGLALVYTVIFLIPGINILFGLILAIGMSFPQVLTNLMLNADNMTEAEIELFDNSPKLSTAIHIFREH